MVPLWLNVFPCLGDGAPGMLLSMLSIFLTYFNQRNLSAEYAHPRAFLVEEAMRGSRYRWNYTIPQKCGLRQACYCDLILDTPGLAGHVRVQNRLTSEYEFNRKIIS